MTTPLLRPDRVRTISAVPVLLVLVMISGVLLAGCSGDPEPPADPDRVVLRPAEDGATPHTHTQFVGDGTWTAPVDLAGGGSYRVVAEFVPAGSTSTYVLGDRATVDGPTPKDDDVPSSSTGSDGLVSVQFPENLPVGDHQFEVTVSDGDDGVLNLGSYLGTYAHVTGFDQRTGAFVHAHPLGTPKATDKGNVLTFHTNFTLAGRFRFFAQVRVDGFVHTVELVSRVG